MQWGDNIKMDNKEMVGGRSGLNSFGSGWGPEVGSCEHNNEPRVSIKGGEFLD